MLALIGLSLFSSGAFHAWSSPGQLPADSSASCRQMRALGGDCYDFAYLGDDRITMLVGDASGKGVAAALMMASVQASLRTAAQFTGDNLAALFRAATYTPAPHHSLTAMRRCFMV